LPTATTSWLLTPITPSLHYWEPLGPRTCRQADLARPFRHPERCQSTGVSHLPDRTRSWRQPDHRRQSPGITHQPDLAPPRGQPAKSGERLCSHV